MDMPKAIQVRDVPDDAHAVLRTRAAAAGMSLSEYLRSELITMTSRPTLAELLERVRSRHGGVSKEEIVGTIRELRDDPE
jgi:plasmid stability protein